MEKYLRARGHEVVLALDGREALTQLFSQEPDVVLLDVQMPERDGWEVLREIRAVSDVPVIMVTVRDATADKVRGLEEGADDYVTKPFDLKEIEARITAVLRRSRRGPQRERDLPDLLQVGPLQIDDRTKEVRLGDEPLRLSRKEYELLRLLCTQPGKVFSSQEILASVWPERPDATAEDVKKYVYFLRGKLEKADGSGPRLETVRGFGYRLINS